MNRSRGTLSFHRLFSTQEIGLGNHAEYFTNGVIRQFLKIGEAVAGRWIEMPLGVLILQMVPGRPDSGAIYLYDRKQQIFYMLGFDGEDDNLTLEEFNDLVAEYDLLRFAEQPSRVQLEPPPPPSLPLPPPPPSVALPLVHHIPSPEISVQGEIDLTIPDDVLFVTKHGVRWYAKPGMTQSHFQSVGSA